MPGVKEWLTIDLLASDSLDVNDPLLTVHLHNLSFAALECASGHEDLIVLPDGNRPHLRGYSMSIYRISKEPLHFQTKILPVQH